MSHSILLVEDNPDDVKLTLRAFERQKLGNAIVVVNDGEEALDYMFGTGHFAGRDVTDQPSVIFLDLKLPRLDGLGVLRRLRADPRTALQPVVILTSSTEERDMVMGYQLGANSFVRKPVDFDQFMEATRELGLYWLLLNQVPKHVPKAS